VVLFFLLLLEVVFAISLLKGAVKSLSKGTVVHFLELCWYF